MIISSKWYILWELISVFDKLIIDFATDSALIGLYFFGNKNENIGIMTWAIFSPILFSFLLPINKDGLNIKVFFISVDPKRDTPEVVKDYLSNFDNQFVGITGDPGEIFLLSQSWGIISQKIFFENGDYNIDHSSPVILLKDGKYIAKISHRDDIKKSIKLINKYL